MSAVDHAVAVQSWEWRLAYNHGSWLPDVDGKPTFHAMDVNNHAACNESCGLFATCEPVNEGSTLCPDCMVVVRRMPQGRSPRVVQP